MALQKVLVTGAGGFVMSVYIAELLKRHPDVSVTALDLAPLDAAAERHLEPFKARIDFRLCDVRDRDQVRDLVADAKPDVVMHGATVTHVPGWEYERPHPFIDVNIGGTLNVLEATRAAGTVRRIVHVSSCAVYGRGDPAMTGVLQDEAGPFNPEDLYGIGKLGGELVAKRFSELHQLPIPVVRFTRVFGPMERPTAARKVMHLPFLLASGMLSGRPVRITRRSAAAVGDWISAEDVADALLRLSTADEATGIYNIAGGRPVPIPELLELFPAKVEWVDDGDAADVDFDPDRRVGQFAVYDVSAIKRDVGWSPRPLAEQMASYLDWARSNPAVFA